ncbi:CCA tRNA nucleotidyltransferase [Paenibacillus sp. EPM92]|uniref:CCA tRNA nucleotidyltransferase n=1 Tax=Paenibacillus sp. EPM92 TaxID=1561195 RepID=UPI0019156D7A|nr:CCA tRNA nucleotidyltransferase [Paenibacillus sp. EPM92]
MKETEGQALKQHALGIVARLNEAGFEAYFVGGCVRDELLGRPVKDYDIATSARPEQVEALFQRTVPTGLQHGTVTVVVHRQPFEVTTFRKEGDYSDYRRPHSVEYIDSLHEDLQRRDFTMNAMAMDLNGRLIDPFGGQADLERGILRCVGSAQERFSEDALRMLRCIRFAAEFGLKPESGTWLALLGAAPLLRHIAMERIRAELERMLTGSDPSGAMLLLKDCRLLAHTKEKLCWARLDEIDSVGELDLRKLTRLEDRLAYLYLKLGAGQGDYDTDMRKLTFAKKQIEEVGRIVEANAWLMHELAAYTVRDAGEPSHEARELWVEAALRYGIDGLQTLRTIYKLDRNIRHAAGTDTVTHPIFTEWIRHGEAWLAEMPVARLRDLAVTGQEVLEALQGKAGPWTGKLLQALLRQAALGSLPNRKEALIQAARELYGEMQEKGIR